MCPVYHFRDTHFLPYSQKLSGRINKLHPFLLWRHKVLPLLLQLVT